MDPGDKVLADSTAPMFFRISPTLAIAALALGLQAEACGGPSAPSLEVRTLSNSRRTTVVAAGADGSFSKDIDRTAVIEIKMRPFSVPKEGFDLEWFFVAKTVAGRERWIFDAGMRHSPGGREELRVQSGPVQAQSDRQVELALRPVRTEEGTALAYTSVVTDTSAGSRYEGWVVRVKCRGEVLRVESSLPELRELALETPLVFDKALGLPLPAVAAP